MPTQTAPPATADAIDPDRLLALGFRRVVTRYEWEDTAAGVKVVVCRQVAVTNGKGGWMWTFDGSGPDGLRHQCRPRTLADVRRAARIVGAEALAEQLALAGSTVAKAEGGGPC